MNRGVPTVQAQARGGDQFRKGHRNAKSRLAGGVMVARRRADRPGWEEDVRRADQMLEQARAADRGWDRELIQAAARRGVSDHRPGFEPASLDLILVDDRPGVTEGPR